jgi:hypothetical protein
MKKILVLLALFLVTTLNLFAYTVNDIPNGYFAAHDNMSDYYSKDKGYQQRVEYLQVLLNADDRLSVSLSEDGLWGDNTKNAVAAFQSEYGLGADGNAGTNTKSKLDEVLQRLKGGGGTTAPPMPAHVVASNDAYVGKIRIYNYAVSSASSYKIYRSTSSSKSDMSYIDTTDDSTEYYDDDSSLQENTKYYYRVKACNDGKCSELSDEYDWGRVKSQSNNQSCYSELQIDRGLFKIIPKSGNDNILNAGDLFSVRANVYNVDYDCKSNNYTLTYKYAGRTSNKNDIPYDSDFKLFDTHTYAGISPRASGGNKYSKSISTVNLSGTHWVKVCVDAPKALHGGDCLVESFEVKGTGNTNTPSPYIHNASTIEFSPIYEGEEASVSIFVTNKGGDSNEGGITVSFPTLTSKADKGRVKSSNEYIVRGQGDTIYNKYGKAIKAKYLMVEFTDTNWKHNERNELNFKIRLDKTGDMPIYIRSAMKDKNTARYINTPSTSIHRIDQQGWSVLEGKFIKVLGIDHSDDYREFSRSELLNFNDNQMYKIAVYNKIFEMDLYQKSYYSMLSKIDLNKYESLEDVKNLVEDTLDTYDGINLLTSKKLDENSYKYIFDNTIKFIENNPNYFPGEDFRTFITTTSSTMSSLFDCLVERDVKSCVNTMFIFADASARTYTTYKIIDNNRAINAHTIALASLRNSIRNGRTYMSDNEIDSEIEKIVEQIDTISTATIFTPYATLYDKVYTRNLIKKYHEILANINYSKLIKLNDDINDVNTDTSNNRPITPRILKPINSSTNVSITPNVIFSSFRDNDGDTHAMTWFDIRKVGNGKYLYDSGWMNATTKAIVPYGYLSYETKYKIRVVYRDSRGRVSRTGYSYFTTAEAPSPTISIQNAIDITQNEATVWSIYDTYGVSGTQTNISWGKTSSLGGNAGSHTIGINESGIDHKFTNLECGKTYYYRANISNVRGENQSEVKHFTTLPCGAKANITSSGDKENIAEYDDVAIGECTTQTITITKKNDQGVASGSVEVLQADNGAFALKGDSSFSLNDNRDKKEFEVEFCPTEEKTYIAVIKATASDTAFVSNRTGVVLMGSGKADSNQNFSGDFYLSGASLDKTTVKAGETLEASVTQKYRGDISEEQKVYVGYYLSADQHWDADIDDRLDRDSSYLSSSNQSEDESDSLTIQADTPVGDYYILFVTDYKKHYDEDSESNNVEYIRITVEDSSAENEDFYITDYNLSQTKFIVGDNTVYISSNLCYSGNNASDAETNIGYYLSRDNRIDASDEVLELDSLGYWRSDRLCRDDRNRVHLKNIEKGEYYIITALDINHTTDEVNEANNIASMKITVSDDISDGNDFYLKNAKAPEWKLYRGEGFRAEVQVNYMGDSSTKLRPYLGYYLSKDNKFDIVTDTFLGEDSSTLRINDLTENEKLDAIIPTDIEVGEYYILFVADYKKQYLEEDETNNVVAVKIGIEVEITANSDKFYPYTQKIIDPSGANNDQFGKVGSDGDWLVVASKHKSRQSIKDAGAVLVYKRNSNNKYAFSQTLFVKDLQDSDYLGYGGVSIYKDTIIVGSVNQGDGVKDNIGAIYVFSLVNGLWEETQKIYSPNKKQGLFGYAYDVSKNTLVASDYINSVSNKKHVGSVYIYEKIGHTWQFKQSILPPLVKENMGFGQQVKIYNKNLVILDNSGYLYIYRLKNSIWKFKQQIKSEYGGIALSNNLLLVKKKLYRYNEILDKWEFEQELNVGKISVSSVAIHNNEEFIAIGSENAGIKRNGKTYIYQYTNGDWNEFKILSPGPRGKKFGSSLVFNNDACIVGDVSASNKSENNTGAVYLYNIARNNHRDSDGDGISNVKEEALGLDPNNPDTDGDGISDLEEVGDINNPRDSDGDGIIDAIELDSDNDGVSDADEKAAGTDPTDKNDKPVVARVSLAPIDDVVMRVNQEKHIALHIVNTTNEKTTIETTSRNQELVVASPSNPLYLTPIHNAKGHTKITVKVSADGKSDTEEFMAYVGEKPKRFVPIMMDDIVVMVPSDD